MTPSEPAIRIAMNELGLDRLQAVRHLQSRELARSLTNSRRLDSMRDAGGEGCLDSPPAPPATELSS